MLPATIGFSDRHQGFIGGSYNGTPVRYARTITDESGLYGQRFWYDALGRIVLSQNTKQFNANPQRFSYSLYDALGRVYEAGELDDDDPNALFRTHVPGMLVGGQFKPDVIDPVVLKAWVQGRTRREVTRTWWDAPMPGLNVPGFTQENLRLRVASSTFREAAASGLTTAYDHATHYSYDIHGNVKELVQSLSRLSGNLPQLGTDGGSCTGCVDHRYKKLRYSYDLISGNVLRVDYGTGDDQMHHRYSYDADNRITEVETSADAVVWHRDAEYFYYPHGPLQRVELGEYKVQGLDYAYTLQGWLKGINSDRLTPETDMGQDGLAGTANALVARDAYGESIGYYGDGDYKAIDATRWGGSLERPFAALGDPQTATGTLHDAYNPLYNGNIAHTVNALQPWGGWMSPTQPAQVLAQVYRYDQLNRLKQAQGVEGLTSANTWDGITDAVADRYKSQYTYDANGNIETVARHDRDGHLYDAMNYGYHTDAIGRKLRNRPYNIQDLADQAENYAQDIPQMAYQPNGIVDPQDASGTINTANNFSYDVLGQRTKDEKADIALIEWTASGKMKKVHHTTVSGKPDITFAYDAAGNRILKQVGDPDNAGYREHYVLDAQGNIMAVYKYTNNGSASLKVVERPVYGSKRLGSYTRAMELMGEQNITVYPYVQPMQAPLKHYELTDHLGNVATVVTGRLLPLLGLGVQYQAEVVSASLHEPFGLELTGMNWQSNVSRFGFQNQIKDLELNAIHFKYREYFPSDGVFPSIDPLWAQYPFYSPYSFSGNRVIDMVELEGLEPAEPGSKDGDMQQARLQGHDDVGESSWLWDGQSETWLSSYGDKASEVYPSFGQKASKLMWDLDGKLQGDVPDNYNRLMVDWGGFMFMKDGPGGSGSPFRAKNPDQVTIMDGSILPGAVAGGSPAGARGSELWHNLTEGLDKVFDSFLEPGTRPGGNLGGREPQDNPDKPLLRQPNKDSITVTIAETTHPPGVMFQIEIKDIRTTPDDTAGGVIKGDKNKRLYKR